MEPTTLVPVISLLLLVSVVYGGWSLLGFLIGRGQLGEFREQFFRAGHAHAGLLLVLQIVYCVYLDRTGYSAGVQWLAGSLLLLGIMAQSGGFFIHLGLGQKNRSSLGTIVTRTGALLLGAALIVLAIGTGGVWWFYWPLLGWGIGLGAHALGVFGFGGGGTGRNARLGR